MCLLFRSACTGSWRVIHGSDRHWGQARPGGPGIKPRWDSTSPLIKIYIDENLLQQVHGQLRQINAPCTPWHVANPAELDRSASRTAARSVAAQSSWLHRVATDEVDELSQPVGFDCVRIWYIIVRVGSYEWVRGGGAIVPEALIAPNMTLCPTRTSLYCISKRPYSCEACSAHT